MMLAIRYKFWHFKPKYKTSQGMRRIETFRSLTCGQAEDEVDGIKVW